MARYRVFEVTKIPVRRPRLTFVISVPSFQAMSRHPHKGRFILFSGSLLNRRLPRAV